MTSPLCAFVIFQKWQLLKRRRCDEVRDVIRVDQNDILGDAGFADNLSLACSQDYDVIDWPRAQIHLYTHFSKVYISAEKGVFRSFTSLFLLFKHRKQALKTVDATAKHSRRDSSRTSNFLPIHSHQEKSKLSYQQGLFVETHQREPFLYTTSFRPKTASTQDKEIKI